MFFIHSFVNLFAGGRSDSKMILFPVYILVLLFFVRFGKKFFNRLSIRWGIISIGALYIYGLVSHLLLFSHYKLPLSSFVIFGNNGEISSSFLYHIHEAKGAIGYTLSLFGIDKLATADAGGAYVGLLPPWWFAIGAVLLLASVFFVIFYINKLSKFYSSDSKWKNALFILWYAVVSFSLVKTAIDGGIFSPTIVSIGLSIFLFWYMQKQKDNRPILLSVFTLSIISMVISLVFPDWPGILILMQTTSMLLLLTTITIGILGYPKKVYLLISVMLFLISWWMASSRDQEIWRYGNVHLDKEEIFFTFRQDTGEVQKNVNQDPTTISKIVKSLGKNLSYAPVSVPGKTCSENGLPQVASMTIFTKQKLTPVKTLFIALFIKDQTFENGWYGSSVVIVSRSCTPEILTAIDDMLVRHGFDFYVMLNPVFNDESIAN